MTRTLANTRRREESFVYERHARRHDQDWMAFYNATIFSIPSGFFLCVMCVNVCVFGALTNHAAVFIFIFCPTDALSKHF